MAQDTYPRIGAKPWAALRAKVATSPSWKITPGTVAATLAMNDSTSAQKNVVSPLKKMGLINDDGGLTDRGMKWRTADGYSAACEEIRNELYPDDLLQLVSGDDEPDRTTIRRWFDQKGFGDSAAKQMTATFALLATEAIPEPPAPSPANGAKKAPAVKKAAAVSRPSGQQAPPPPPPSDPPPSDSGPSLHLDIQIHIPPDASPEQLDAIFASMAKHLYKR